MLDAFFASLPFRGEPIKSNRAKLGMPGTIYRTSDRGLKYERASLIKRQTLETPSIVSSTGSGVVGPAKLRAAQADCSSAWTFVEFGDEENSGSERVHRVLLPPLEINSPAAPMKFPRAINSPAAEIVARPRHRNCSNNPACRGRGRSWRVIKSFRRKRFFSPLE